MVVSAILRFEINTRATDQRAASPLKATWQLLGGRTVIVFPHKDEAARFEQPGWYHVLLDFSGNADVKVLFAKLASGRDTMEVVQHLAAQVKEGMPL